MSLDKTKLVGQGLDGANNMSGNTAGLCTLVKSRISEKAIYVHCYAHRLNLALENACGKIRSCSEIIKTAQELHSYVEGSAKRHHLFQHIQNPESKTTLKKLCETRWDHRHNSFKAIKKSLPSLLTFLKIQDDETTAACSVKASVLLDKIQNFTFIFYLELLNSCFEVINILSQALQKTDVDIMNAQRFYKDVVNQLNDMKTDENYDIFYSKLILKAHVNNIEDETKHGKKRGRKATFELTKSDEYKEKYSLVIETLVNELNFRFKDENIKPLVVIQKIITNISYDKDISIRNELHIYKDEIDFDKLDEELNIWYRYKLSNPNEFGTKKINILSQQFSNCDLSEHLNEIHKLFLIYLCVPVTSATGERSFSTLKLLKTYIRNSMKQDRLSDLAVLYTNTDLLNKISLEDIIDKFAREKSRRMKFCN